MKTYIRTEFLPILQDFVPYRGRCPATIEVTIEKTIKETVEQGKGTGDHLMPLGDWLFFFCVVWLLMVDFSPCWAHFGPLLGAKILQSMTVSSLAPNSIR